MTRYRPAISTLLFVLMAVCVAVSTFAIWAGSTLYDSAAFSERAVEVLDAPVVRKELASRITEQLARNGNQQAINFRPAFQFAVEVAADTDTFKSIFRNAIRRAHEAVIAGQGSGAGIDLTDTLGIIGATLQLPGTAQQGQGNLNNSFNDVTKKIADLPIWSLEDTIGIIAIGALLLGVALAAAGIFVALDRRRAVVRLGLALVLAGGLVILIRFLAELAARRVISDGALANAVGSAINSATADLRVTGLWIAAYGVVVAAAASPTTYTPRYVWGRVSAWGERRRLSRSGRILVPAGLIVLGIAITSSPGFWSMAAALLAGLWIAYYGISELVRLIRRRHVDVPVTAKGERRRLVLAGAAVALVLALVTGGFIFFTRRAAQQAQAAGELHCNGEVDLCGVRLDEVVFPGTHNSMSSSLYPGWLFGEQIGTIKSQLDDGIRALLIDTHYGVPTSVKVPGADTTLVVTDRAAELSAPTGEDIDPAIAARAQSLAARVPKNANAKRGIYLCHNFCELGSVTFLSQMRDVKNFLDTHPDEVLMMIIQDATTPADTAAVLEQAGLGEDAFTLQKGQPLPTLREMIDAGKRLLVFAEGGGPGAPDWYMKAYDWFQETGYSFNRIDGFDCSPNRGSPNNPLFLINHWVSASPPNPDVARQANARTVLERRMTRCLQERGRIPNVVAVDFGERGDLVALAADVDQDLRKDREDLGDALTALTTVPGATTSAAPGAAPTTVPVGDVAPIPTFTQVTTLTGGNAEAFCAAYPSARIALDDWSVAVVSAPPGEQGDVDLVFAPLLKRELDQLYAVAPEELVTLATKLRARLDQAINELRQLGLNDNEIEAQATFVRSSIDENTDAVTVQLNSLDALRSRRGADAVNAAADRLTAAINDSLAAIDLGNVSDQVAVDFGYGCLVASSNGSSTTATTAVPATSGATPSSTTTTSTTTG